MAKSNFIEANFENGTVRINMDNDQQSVAATFLYNLTLPFIESYWMTLTYFMSAGNRN